MKTFSLFIFALFLTACTSLPKQALDAQAARQIKRLALVEISEPVQYTVLNLGHPGMLFGAIGGAIAGAIAGADMQSKAEQFTQAVKNQGFAPGKALLQTLSSRLKEQGYAVETLPAQCAVPAAGSENKALNTSAACATSADGVLTVEINSLGYVANSVFSSYQPTFGIRAQLSDAARLKTLYQDYFIYGWKPTGGDWVLVPEQGALRLGSFDALLSQTPQAVAGLQTGIGALSERVVQAVAKK